MKFLLPIAVVVVLGGLQRTKSNRLQIEPAFLLAEQYFVQDLLLLV